MAVAQDYRLDVAGRELYPAHVLGEAVGGRPRVEEHPMLLPVLPDHDERPESVLDDRLVESEPALHEGGRYVQVLRTQ
jgi:hypothetical protein